MEMVEDVVRLLDHLQNEKAHVIGLSMGGALTNKLRETHPDRLLTAVLALTGWSREGIVAILPLNIGNYHDIMPIMHLKTTLDRFGRVLIPKKVRVELGLSAGDSLEVESRDDGILIKPLHDEPHLVDKEGVLVFSGAPMGNVVEAVRKHREERLDKQTGAKN
jgi:AbrB family looped-hinge helix DNA binding protein